MAGFCTNAGIVGLYAIIAQVFPTQVRAFGTGFTVGVGRGGSVLAPIIAGFLFTAGYSLPVVALTMASGSILAAAVLLMLKLGERPVVPREDRPMRAPQLPTPRPAR
jgi:MFS family permease